MYSLVVGASSLRAIVVIGIRRGVAITGERMASRTETMMTVSRVSLSGHISEGDKAYSISQPDRRL